MLKKVYGFGLMFMGLIGYSYLLENFGENDIFKVFLAIGFVGALICVLWVAVLSVSQKGILSSWKLFKFSLNQNVKGTSLVLYVSTLVLFLLPFFIFPYAGENLLVVEPLKALFTFFLLGVGLGAVYKVFI